MTDKPAGNEPIGEEKTFLYWFAHYTFTPGLERTDTPLLEIAIGLHNIRKEYQTMITGFTARADGLLYGGAEPVTVYDIDHSPKTISADE